MPFQQFTDLKSSHGTGSLWLLQKSMLTFFEKVEHLLKSRGVANKMLSMWKECIKRKGLVFTLHDLLFLENILVKYKFG